MKKRVKKKGFTLVELLGILVILAIIALILVPIISNVIDASRKAAFKESVNGIIDSTNNYTGEYILDKKDDLTNYPVVFDCDGVACKSYDNKELTFKGEVPKSGKIIMTEDGVLAEYISNGKYCAYGYKWDMIVGETCNDVDSTKPTVAAELVGTSLHITLTDLESGISGYCVTTENNASTCTFNSTESNYVEHNLTGPGIYFVFSRDKRGNISDGISVNAPESAFNYVATKTTYNGTLACSDGRTLSNGNCTYYYSSNSSKCGTESCNCSCNGWTCIDKGKCHAYDPSGNGQCINWDANWCNVNACTSQSCSTCAKSCTLTENGYRYYACNAGDINDGTVCYHYECPDGGTLDLASEMCIR